MANSVRKIGPGMNRRTVLSGAASVAAVAAGPASAGAATAASPVARTAAGRVRGYGDGGIKVFKGVPYGADTGGANRWLAPKPPKPWTGVRKSVEFGPICPQTFGAPMAEETALLQKGPMGEDCLTLNVWTPAVGARSGKRPVMVWFHGGAFAGGSGGAATYDGVNLCRKHDVVLVTVTHRLNAFGFLNLAELAGPAYADSGVAGMLDCVAALKWVRDNIAGFGGDPGTVTIFGQSGGGAKVTTLMAMPAAKGLFHRVIAQSGLEVQANPPAMATGQARAILGKLGIGADRMADLQAVPAEQLVKALEANPGLAYGLGPVRDGRNLPADPFAPAAPSVSADVPLMLGNTETEVVFFPNTPLDPIDDAALKTNVKGYTGLGDADADTLIGAYKAEYPGRDNTYLYQVLGSDWWLTDTVATVAERKAALGRGPAYVYYFAKHTPVRGGKLKAPHTLEIPYLFDTLALGAPIIGPVTPEQQALADRMSRTWTAFARTGKPDNPSIPHWPAYDAKARQVMVMDDHFAVAADPHPRTRLATAAAKAKVPARG